MRIEGTEIQNADIKPTTVVSCSGGIGIFTLEDCDRTCHEHIVVVGVRPPMSFGVWHIGMIQSR